MTMDIRHRTMRNPRIPHKFKENTNLLVLIWLNLALR